MFNIIVVRVLLNSMYRYVMQFERENQRVLNDSNI